ncbi:MAG: DUF11 domain-containing protein [Kouleothrix sp.]
MSRPRLRRRVVGQALSWSLGSLPPTGAAPAGIITVRVQVDTNAPATLSNRASISTSTPSDDPGDNTSTITTQIIRPNVFVQKTGPATVTAGDQLIYTLAYGNAGDAPAASVALVDTLPADLTFVSANPAPTGVAGQSLTWALGTLAPGQRGSISVVAQASALAASGSVALNQAGISTATPGDDPGDNTSSTATIVQRADVRVTKSSPTSFPVASGQPVAYDIDYANAGPATARNVTLNDTVPAQIANVVWQCSSGCAGQRHWQYARAEPGRPGGRRERAGAGERRRTDQHRARGFH